ncbi:DUF3887 domain-containing protein [Dethiobacter alkaliphilus]|uniref:DUF3887 domain-containing protein n=1 Tax=Dethiobacter alkaliphilus AHT 1 TaxID=555088 RepID=C0GEI3_DETAL|nr:DUF3887 domain-containing protein [Dethiobacter alkaliphilus]EEG78477.1 hypothetical protein DealDRAFT_0892 [Dethiobacter alkaliphilus AHT 1]
MLKRFAVFCLLVIFVFVLASCGQSGESDVNEELYEKASEFVSQLVDGDYSSAFASFDDDMKAALPQSDLQAAWEQVITQVGDYKGEVGKRTDQVDGYDRVFVNSEFEDATIDIIVVFNSEKEISGLFFQ